MTKTYTTELGDMWDSIALSQLGNSYYSNQLIDANRKYSDVVVFEPGVILVIPELVISEQSKVNLPPWR